MTAPSTAYPVLFEIDYPENPGRLSILVRWILAIPQFIVASILARLAQLLAFFALFTILFTKRYPEGMFRLVVGAYRWQYNVTIYALIHPSPYPPFSMDAGVYPHFRYDVTRSDEYNRWLPLVKWLLAIPHYIVLTFLGLLAIVVGVYSVLAVVFTGTFPRGAFDYLVGFGRWAARVTAYLLLQVDQYPPFSMS
jgi:Domain of unknown function (DUF4389)